MVEGLPEEEIRQCVLKENGHTPDFIPIHDDHPTYIRAADRTLFATPHKLKDSPSEEIGS